MGRSIPTPTELNTLTLHSSLQPLGMPSSSEPRWIISWMDFCRGSSSSPDPPPDGHCRSSLHLSPRHVQALIRATEHLYASGAVDPACAPCSRCSGGAVVSGADLSETGRDLGTTGRRGSFPETISRDGVKSGGAPGDRGRHERRAFPSEVNTLPSRPRITTRWADSSVRLVEALGATSFQKECTSVLQTIQQRPGVSVSLLYRTHRRLRKREFDEILEALDLQGRIRIETQPTSTHGRPPRLVYPIGGAPGMRPHG